MAHRFRDAAYNEQDLEVDQAIGFRLRKFRRLQNISQSKLANCLSVTFQQIQKYEAGKTRLSASMMVNAAAVLNISVSELIGETRQKTPGDSEIIAILAIPGSAELLDLYFSLAPEQRKALRAFAVSIASNSRARHTSGDRRNMSS